MRTLTIVALVLLALTLVAIYLLARQDTAGTRRLAWQAEHLLMRIIPPTGTGDIGEPTWLGLSIRRIAHIVEYALLGAFAAALCLSGSGSKPRQALCAMLICLLASIADEAHKIFVPGRHFDPVDLVLDALGYIPVICLCLVVCLICS